MNNWPSFVRGMRENPESALHMGVAADYLQEQGDVRWEALAWMFDHGKVGRALFGFERGYWCHTATDDSEYIVYEWLTSRVLNHRVTTRLFLLHRYAKADPETRAKWLAESTAFPRK